MPHRRNGPRKTQICGVHALWTDQEGTVTRLAGLVEDRSRYGVSICVPEPIEIGTRVKIRGRNRELEGTVRHCRYTAGKYCVGIHLDREDSAWDRFGAGL
jgi:hypothetical protein